MSNIEIGPSRPVGAVPVKKAAADPAAPTPAASTGAALPAAAPPAPPGASSAAAATVATSDAARAGDVPVDSDRVAQIRKAIEQGHYPVLPARLADAMIAAGMLLRTSQ
jgi:negative regulator of flagellin synthesis FlgM